MQINKLIGLKEEAKKAGWDKFIRTDADENALLAGHTFSFEAFDNFRFYIQNFLKLSKGKWKGDPFSLLPFQELICGSIFGWVESETGLRRYRRGYIEIGKKNGKSSLLSAIALYMLDGDGEPGAEVYTVANDLPQATLLWSLSADMVEQSPKLNKRITVVRSRSRMFLDHNTIYSAWSSDQSSKDGPNIHCAIVDELHEWKGGPARDFWRKIRYGGIARSQPLCPLVITTAGDDKNSLCYEQHTYARKILDGTINNDFRFYPEIYGADPKKMQEDPNYWETEEAWKAANPAYEVILKKEDFEADVVEAKQDPTSKAAFLRYRLGFWVSSSNPWINIRHWDESATESFNEDDLKGQVCFGGIDLASVNDFVAVVYDFPYFVKAEVLDLETNEKKLQDTIKHRIVTRIYIPEEKLIERIQKIDVCFQHWVEQGYIRMTPGSAIDIEFIFDEIKKDASKFVIKEIGYDRYSAAWLIQAIQKNLPAIQLFPISQAITAMSNPTKALQVAILKGLIEHNNNPVLRWCVGNCVPRFDANGNVHLSKSASTEKIDPVVALVMAHHQASLGDLVVKKKTSVYSDEFFNDKMKELEGINFDSEK